MEIDEGQELYVYRRNITQFINTYFVSAGFALLGIPLGIVTLFYGKMSPQGNVAMAVWTLAIIYGIHTLLFRTVLDFTCTESSLGIKTAFGPMRFIPWSEITGYWATRIPLPHYNMGQLKTTRGKYWLSNMSRDPLDRLREIVRSHSSATVRRGWFVGW